MSKDDYAVGYAKPPKSGQFKPGQSGNPKGRPKGVKNLKTDLLEELQGTVPVKQGGKTRHLTRQRAMVKSMVRKAILGDPRATHLVVSMMANLMTDDASNGKADLSQTDRDILEAYQKQILDEAKSARRGRRD